MLLLALTATLLLHLCSAETTLVEVDVEDFGARADNETLSSEGINAALSNVSARGGGVVHARADGTYRVARIELKSHTQLRIGPNTTLYASDRAKDWTEREVEVPAKCGGKGIVQNATRGGVFFAVRQTNFSIVGGTVNGGGAIWNNDLLRCHFMEFYFCSDVVVEDMRILNSSMWTLRPSYSQRLSFRRLTILGDTTGVNHHNTDGFDPWASKDVSFTDSYYEAGDDCVAVKSGKNNDPRPWESECGVPCENIYVNNITCAHAHGLTIGSEIASGIRNVTFTNVRINSGSPVKLKSLCGRGAYIQDVLYENITGYDIDGPAISMDMRYGGGSTKPCPENETSVFSNITVRNVVVKKAVYAFTFVGDTIKGDYKRPTINQVTLDNVTVHQYEHKSECTHANITVRNISPGPKASDATCQLHSGDVPVVQQSPRRPEKPSKLVSIGDN